jgi:hypothetical protein
MRRRELAAGLTLAALTVAGAGLAGCKRNRGEGAKRASGAPGAPALPPPLAGKSFYRIDAGPQTPCTAGSPCEARIVLTALAGYKVNKDYPFKFLAEPVPGITVDGPGTFAFDDVKTGTLTLRFRAAQPGPARFSGTFKLSVCTAEQCEIEEPKIELSIPVT